MAKAFDTFINAVVNSEFTNASRVYSHMPETELPAASGVFHVLVRNHQNVQLATTLRLYLELNVNGLNRKKQSPLHVAFHHANKAAIDKLLEAGADPHAADGYGNTIVNFAEWSKVNAMVVLAKTLTVAKTTKPKPVAQEGPVLRQARNISAA